MNLNFTLLLQVISFLILLGLLTKFLYRPFMKYLEDRARQARDITEKAKEAEEKARLYAEETQKALDAAKHEALKLKEESKRLADKERIRTIKHAKEEAGRLIEEAKEQIGKEEESAAKRVRSKIGDLSLEIAAKILGREIKKDDHKRFAEESIEEIESGPR